jgi:undecaprenyl diphosphate synthase
MPIKQESIVETVKELVQQGLVKHVAIIMDGNRRWAKQNNLPKTLGHHNGRKTFKAIVKHSTELGLGYLTTYAFSTENWGRDHEEVGFLMGLLVESLKNEIKELCDNNIKIKFIGRRDRLNQQIVEMMHKAELDTSKNTGLTLQIALDYGSRFEITNAVKNLIQDLRANKFSIDNIDEDLLNSYLYTSDVPDPDLIIRTGGEYRLSNYLLWQAAYSELYITSTFWPDFSEEEFDKALIDFSKRQRRWGKD